MCSSKKYPYPPLRAFLFSTPTPPGISLIFQLGWIPPGMNILVKNAFALYFYAILFLGYREKKIFMFTLIQCQII